MGDTKWNLETHSVELRGFPVWTGRAAFKIIPEMASLGALVGGPLGEEDVEELRSERSIRGLKVNIKGFPSNLYDIGLCYVVSTNGLANIAFLRQSQEEIERLTVDENLDDIERAVLLLRWVKLNGKKTSNNYVLIYSNPGN